MKCECCGDHEATVHYAEVVDGKMKKMNLCEHCAASKGVGINSNFSINDLFGGLTDTSPTDHKEEGLICSMCGMSYDEFKKRGRLGCSQCYDTFKKVLDSLLEAIHKSKYHTGKMPKRLESDAGNEAKLRKLKEDLRSAIGKENFEKAAKIRDEIKKAEPSKNRKKKSKIE